MRPFCQPGEFECALLSRRTAMSLTEAQGKPFAKRQFVFRGDLHNVVQLRLRWRLTRATPRHVRSPDFPSLRNESRLSSSSNSKIFILDVLTSTRLLLSSLPLRAPGLTNRSIWIYLLFERWPDRLRWSSRFCVDVVSFYYVFKIMAL